MKVGRFEKKKWILRLCVEQIALTAEFNDVRIHIECWIVEFYGLLYVILRNAMSADPPGHCSEAEGHQE